MARIAAVCVAHEDDRTAVAADAVDVLGNLGELSVLGVAFTMWGAGMGVRGAALATSISRFVELLVVLTYAHLHQDRYVFLKGAYRNGYVPLHLLKKIAITGSPLMLNEVLWSLGMTFINQCYSTRGMTALAALNITSTAWNLFCIIMFAMGNAVSIKYHLPIGAHDMKTVAESLEVRPAAEDDTFVPFGSSEEDNPEAGEIVYVSDHQVRTRRWTWRQSEVGKMTEKTAGVLYPIDGFSDVNLAEVKAAMKDFTELLANYFARSGYSCTVETGLVDKDNRRFEF